MDKFIIKSCKHKIHLLLTIHLLIDPLEKIPRAFTVRNRTMRQTKRESLDPLLLSKEINKRYWAKFAEKHLFGKILTKKHVKETF